MKGTLTPILLVIQLVFFFTLARRHVSLPRERAAVLLYLLLITTYAVATSAVGATGAFVADDLLRWLPALWLQLVTVAVCVLPVAISRRVRDGLRQIVDSTPRHWFAYFHGLRVAAIGTAYKTFIGEFPAYFELLIGVPDFLFGLSAFWIASKARRGALKRKTFRAWNLVGALIIVPAAPILLQLGLPGPLQLFTSQPDARAVFTFPMSIASMIVVPLFVLANLLVAWRLWETTEVQKRRIEPRTEPREARNRRKSNDRSLHVAHIQRA